MCINSVIQCDFCGNIDQNGVANNFWTRRIHSGPVCYGGRCQIHAPKCWEICKFWKQNGILFYIFRSNYSIIIGLLYSKFLLSVFHEKRQDFCSLKKKKFNWLSKSKFPKIIFRKISWFDMYEVEIRLSLITYLMNKNSLWASFDSYSWIRCSNLDFLY